MMNFIDTHAHLCSKFYDNDYVSVIQRAINAHVSQVILPCVNSTDIPEIFEAVEKFPFTIFPLIGLHPTEVNENYLQELDTLYPFLSDKRVVGVGEIGMDLYHDSNYLSQQQDAFYRQLGWASDLKMPLSLHIRSAYEESIQILKSFTNSSLKGVLHCFSGGIKEAEWAIQFGFVLGIGGVITFKNNKLQDIVKEIGLNHIVLETDAPFLAPAPYRGQTNESAYIPIIAQKIAEIFQTSVEDVMSQTTQTALNIFNLKQI